MLRLALVAALLALAAPAVASAARSQVITDCRRNDGVVAGQYSVGALKRAYRSIPRARRVADNCGQSVASHVAALRGRKGGREAGAVLDDCTRHGGRLTRRFAPHALTRAATRMTTARREQTRCLIGIYSQLRARERPIAVGRPGLSRVKGPYNDQTGDELFFSLGRFTQDMREPAEPYDMIPPNVIEVLLRRNENRGDGFSFVSVRRVGPGDTPVWLVTADGRMCAIRWYGDTIPPDVRCIAANRWAKGAGLLTVRDHSDGSHDVWGVVPDAFTRGRLLFADGSTRPLIRRSNGVLHGFGEMPGAIEWTAGDGKQWFDPTTVPCRVSCLRVPRVAGIR